MYLRSALVVSRGTAPVGASRCCRALPNAGRGIEPNESGVGRVMGYQGIGSLDGL